MMDDFGVWPAVTNQNPLVVMMFLLRCRAVSLYPLMTLLLQKREEEEEEEGMTSLEYLHMSNIATQDRILPIAVLTISYLH